MDGIADTLLTILFVGAVYLFVLYTLIWLATTARDAYRFYRDWRKRRCRAVD